MLIRPNDIYGVKPPFLIIFGNGDWKVAEKIAPHQEGVAFFEPFSARPDDLADGVVQGAPWHVGDNVWEMDYNAQIMTLNHPHCQAHPAWRLWLQWLATMGHSEAKPTH